jgi:hypothetical protein
MGDGASRASSNEPGKYRGFWERFNRETARRAEERKSD